MSVGDTGSIPGPGRPHMPQATKTVRHNWQAELQNPQATTNESESCSCCSPHAWSLCSATREATTMRSIPPTPPKRLEKRPCMARKTQHNQKSVNGSRLLKTNRNKLVTHFRWHTVYFPRKRSRSWKRKPTGHISVPYSPVIKALSHISSRLAYL